MTIDRQEINRIIIDVTNEDFRGFTKKKALALCEEIVDLRGAMEAADDRLHQAGLRVGIIGGCDTPHDMADEIESLRADNKSLKEENQPLRNADRYERAQRLAREETP